MRAHAGRRAPSFRGLVKTPQALSRVPSAQQKHLMRLARGAPAPELAANHLARLIEAGGPQAFKNFPAKMLRPLVTLLGSSSYLSDVLIGQGKDWAPFFLNQVATARRSVTEHLRLLDPCARGASLEEFMRDLRRHKKREMVRIAARDLAGLGTVEETMRELSALAEASLEACYRFCRSEIERQFGSLARDGGEQNRFVILGMGKLGGEELNLSSDVDLIYLYESDEGESSGGASGTIAPRGFFSHLAEMVTRAMGEVTEDGFVFRIDLRLRPLGRHGPIVQSVDSALLYYESWGQCWERSALIKARPVAGERPLGEEFLKQVTPFVYRRYLDFTTVEELREMKARVERELLSPVERQRNVKLGQGGIREIEFFTQALQLVNGGYEPRLRERNTLRALALLAEHGLIERAEERTLSEAYRFLRDVEHKIQVVQEAQSHLVPEGKAEQRFLARRLGYRKTARADEVAGFQRDYRRHTRAVRRIFDRLFYSAQKEIVPKSGAPGEEIWRDLDDEERVTQRLAGLGFPDPRRAYDSLLALRDGATFSPPSPRRLKVMRALGPALMEAVLESAAPDEALRHLAEFMHRVGARTGFLSLLAENPSTMRALVRLFTQSQFLTEMFVQRPELLDSLIRADLTQVRKPREQMERELRATLEQTGDVEERLDRLRRYRAEEFIRIGLHDLAGETELGEVTAQLTDLAEACLEGALYIAAEETRRAHGKIARGKFSVLGMGKLGGRELDYNSDLDLIFIYDAPDDALSDAAASSLPAHDYYVRLGQKLITALTAPTAEGIAYRIDMRLRPSGRSGPLVVSLDAFRRYHRESSELWERQALIKLRFVAGERDLGRAAEEIAENFAFGRGLSEEGVAEIDHLRMRMERELARENASRFNLKKGRGGMVDVEFLTQMLQLRHGQRDRRLRLRGTLEALDALLKAGIMAKKDHRLLAESYLFLRRLDHRLRLERGQSLDIVEREPAKLEAIAAALGYRARTRTKAAALLLRDYERRREQIRACYERFFRARLKAGGEKNKKEKPAAENSP
ncbi:MAG TPA: bifunctional [glutamate--ammonia ligase]-adenylyl-L-tyrosine phosphorylase/[glutamate--ammonia-ligase] adenylyltransferase [Candidatus Acidoferrales bacterium]|nr:bifunctional [glutamate--ammonia ligase]-adenylyl-L-tyrosine phosphorylase/[glutamate--ammonia-ligase] adenylyltransferase [Candidatus Acidoferrales bacterium]